MENNGIFKDMSWYEIFNYFELDAKWKVGPFALGEYFLTKSGNQGL